GSMLGFPPISNGINTNLDKKIAQSIPDKTMDITEHQRIQESLGVLEPGRTHIGTRNVNIIKISIINIICNIIQGSYHNGENKHILHSFYPTVPPGFRIVEKPHNLVYLPLNNSHISDVVVSVVDQDGDFVNLRNETISLRI
ncbi:hypothetical protein, partial [Klebsiella pneumoniae]|uniref:hypothetical protein n=1 Tax=Klebsiella pneumoniae TaxID=573 RepID=UPI001C8F46E9